MISLPWDPRLYPFSGKSRELGIDTVTWCLVSCYLSYGRYYSLTRVVGLELLLFYPGIFFWWDKRHGEDVVFVESVCVCVCGNFSNYGRYQVKISWRTEDSVGMFFLILGK